MKYCQVCKSEVKIFCRLSKHIIYKCQSCGLGFTNNLNGQDNDYHRDEYYIQQKEQLENIFQKRVKNVIRYKKTGKVLEIGSSTGLMLSLFKKEGWEILGIEMSKQAANYAISVGVPTLITHFEKATLDEGSFDAVILNHTLEHLSNPREILKKIYQLLKNDGLLLIDVPNFGSLSAQIWQGKWPYLLPNEHLWHFTYPSLEKLLIQENFQICQTKMASGIWDYNNPLLEIWQSFKGFKKRFFINLVSIIPATLLTIFNFGTGLMVVAKK